MRGFLFFSVCSAGCGRTGTICAVDFAWTLLKMQASLQQCILKDRCFVIIHPSIHPSLLLLVIHILSLPSSSFPLSTFRPLFLTLSSCLLVAFLLSDFPHLLPSCLLSCFPPSLTYLPTPSLLPPSLPPSLPSFFPLPPSPPSLLPSSLPSFFPPIPPSPLPLYFLPPFFPSFLHSLLFPLSIPPLPPSLLPLSLPSSLPSFHNSFFSPYPSLSTFSLPSFLPSFIPSFSPSPSLPPSLSTSSLPPYFLPFLHPLSLPSFLFLVHLLIFSLNLCCINFCRRQIILVCLISWQTLEGREWQWYRPR